MPGKSRYAKGKHPSRSKKGRSKRRLDLEGRDSLDTVAQQQPVSRTYGPVSQPRAPAPSTSIPTPVATQAAARYPFAAAELRRIGILAGIMLAVLVVLALALS